MTKTEENLKTAFAGESQARNKYDYFAKVARKEGYHYIAKIFEETALNEKQHAKDEFKLLLGIGDTVANLKEAIKGEDYETSTMYPDFARQAETDGNREAAVLFSQIAKVEKEHRERYKKLLEMDYVKGSAGSPCSSIELNPKELLKLPNVQVVDITED